MIVIEQPGENFATCVPDLPGQRWGSSANTILERDMCLCGLKLTRRDWLSMSMVASGAALVPGRDAQAQEASDQALSLLKDVISVDLHSHARGLSFSPEPNDSLAVGMRAGNLSAACLAHVPDGPVIGIGAGGVLGMVRKPAPGDLYRGHLGRLSWVDRLVRDQGIRRVLNNAELIEAKSKGQPAIIQDIEGCDFLDGRIERIEEAVRRGVRVIQLVHYIPNDIGDFQTGPVAHNGLTEFGAKVIQEMNRLGVVVDVAHSTEAMARAAVKASSRPLLLSHTALQGSRAMGNTPLAGRQISADHARAIAETGGVIGVWHFFAGIARYAQGIREMVDVVGVDHVGLGTDQQTAPGSVQDYASLPRVVDQLMKVGFKTEEIGKLLGGNFLRLWEKVAMPA